MLPDDIEGVLILNIHSYMGGVDLWASGFNSTTSMKTGKQSLCDGMLEVSPALVHPPLQVSHMQCFSSTCPTSARRACRLAQS